MLIGFFFWEVRQVFIRKRITILFQLPILFRIFLYNNLFFLSRWFDFIPNPWVPHPYWLGQSFLSDIKVLVFLSFLAIKGLDFIQLAFFSILSLLSLLYHNLGISFLSPSSLHPQEVLSSKPLEISLFFWPLTIFGSMFLSFMWITVWLGRKVF